MSSVIISQPMYFPWLGLFNQMQFCDKFIHYDDVFLSRGFINRVQVKTKAGTDLITVPIKNRSQNILIKDSVIDCCGSDWVSVHRNKFIDSIRGARFRDIAIEIFDGVFSQNYTFLSELNIASIEAIAKYSSRFDHISFYRSSDIIKKNASSERLLHICKEHNATSYITGHGALSYLNHEIFDNHNIDVKYIQYGFNTYKQSFGEFTPFVTCLDSIAHLGNSFVDAFDSSLLYWREVDNQPLFK